MLVTAIQRRPEGHDTVVVTALVELGGQLHGGQLGAAAVAPSQ